MRCTRRLLLLLLVAMLVLATMSPAGTWGGGKRLARSGLEVEVAVGGDDVHAVWSEVITIIKTDIWYRGSDDGGATWGPRQRIVRTGP